MTELRARMIEDMQLRSLAERTQEAYVGAVRQLAKYYMRAPDLLTEEQVRHYFLHLMNIEQAPATIRLRLYGIRFLYEVTLGLDWPKLKQIRIKLPKRLPTVLNRKEVALLLSRVFKPKLRMALTLIYSCGLRLSEAVYMHQGQVDIERLVVHVHGKGSKDRCVPLPARTAELLGAYWAEVQPRTASPFLFAGKGKGAVCKTSVQRAFRSVVEQSEIGKRATVHTLRHCYATHLLELGVGLRVIQGLLGHSKLQTTLVYTHLTQTSVRDLHQALDRLMSGL